MKSHDVKGLPATTSAGSDDLGQVERAYLDPITWKIAGFAVGTGARLFSTESSRMVDAAEIAALHPTHGLIVKDAGALGASMIERYGELRDLDDLTRLTVYTEGGVLLGHVVGSELNEQTLTVQSLEVAAHHFGAHPHIPVDQVITVGPELIIVRNEAVPPVPTPEREPVASDATAPIGSDRLDVEVP